jgi:PTS system mannose-specific IIA component
VIPAPEDAGPGSSAVPGGFVPALLVMHADLAAALLHAATSVYGEISGVQVLSNEGLSRDQIEERIAAEVAPWREGGLLLTDFWGGSCHTCAMAAARGNGHIVLLTGVNLPMLLDYLHNRTNFGVEALAERMQQRGRDNIRTQRGPGA